MYLLLRDNKQSGPFSLEELKTMGLKAYDLVWVEGKSAAWRYPCEIEQLKDFAPVVEEQPFDRFYKKSSSPVKANANSSSESTVPGKRIIYVTLPSGRIAAPVVQSSSTASAAPAYTPAPSPAPAPVQPTYNPPERYTCYPVEDYSSQHPSDESTLVEFLPRTKKRGSNRFVKPLAISLSILALLAAGIFIGLSINRDTLPFQQKIALNSVPQEHSSTQQLPVPAATNAPAPVTAAEPADSVATIVSQPAVTESRISNSTPPVTKTQKEKLVNPQNPKASPLATAATKDSALTVSPAHRETTHRNDPEVKTESSDKDAAARVNLYTQVAASSNGYTVGTFGGISDLQVTVTNHSAYPLDLVVVEVQYIQSNKKIFKTENLYFRSIGAGSALMQEAPKSSRGIRVQYKITTINSRDLGLVDAGT